MRILMRALVAIGINIGAFCVMAVIMAAASIMVYVAWSYVLPFDAI